MEHDIHDGSAWRLVLQRYRRQIRRRSVHWRCVRRARSKKAKETTNKRYVVSRFTIGSDGSLVVTVGVRQAIAVHVGALGIGTGAPLTAQQVPVLFYENANTTLGEVRAHSFFFFKAWLAGSSLTQSTEYFRRGKRTATRQLGPVQRGASP